MSTKTLFFDLLDRYILGEITASEQQQLMQLLENEEYIVLLQQHMQAQFEVDSASNRTIFPSSTHIEQLHERLEATATSLEESHITTSRKKTTLKYWSWAAAGIILFAVGSYFIFSDPNPLPATIADSPKFEQELLPEKKGAILTLADGSEVQLDAQGNGIVANENGTSVVITNGQLAYQPTDGALNNAVQPIYNTLSVPKGRQFNVTLPDGTKVWLNAASTLRYPIAFTGDTRLIELVGEAYFEVAKHATMPFWVSVNKQFRVEALGTSFNINAYSEDNVQHTTLIDGAVRVHKEATNSIILHPGQQAQTNTTIKTTGALVQQTNTKQQALANTIKIVENVDLDKILAWKNGAFNFEEIHLAVALQQLARWYDLEIVYANGVPKVQLTGQISRNVSLNSLLKGLEEAQLHFRLEQGKRLVILQ